MQDRAARTRRHLIRSAAEVFDRGGFAGSSIGQICDRARASHGALHFHFGNKQALGRAVESTAAEILLCITGRVPDQHPQPLQLLVDTSYTLAEHVVCDPVLRAGFRLAHDASWHSGVSLWQHWQDWVRGLLVLARRQGSLAPGVDLEDAVFAITAMMAGLESLERVPARPCGVPRSVAPFWRLLLPQLTAEAVLGWIDAERSASSVSSASAEHRRNAGDRTAGQRPYECGAALSGEPLCCCAVQALQGDEGFGLVGPVQQLQEAGCLGQGHRADPADRDTRCP
ncbi:MULTISPECIES: ScbR family autoregulator-binding transcription factor [Streptomyces]|uniref:HTH tetR-type domain-containing protein n=2 Tax=Streptomyces thermogriseus TaxID=75292 RepID=A0ABP4DLZ0_9ACTN|nr:MULTISPECIES: ScbR family autoregulator-binding transcription factor [Streptomyces]MDN5383738.1 ScbR family autoregulator-binding transcription factor [Streptomyces sp. LB8]